MFGILHRTIFMELAKVFVLSLAGITGIIVMAAIVVEASQRGYGPMQILEAIPLLVPSMMPFIIPPTTLFASCVVYGRLSHDNEITAIKAAGVNVLHVIWPGVFLGLIMSLATLGLFIHLIPYTHLLLRTAITNDVEEFLYSMLKRDRQIRRTPALKINYEMWCEQVQGRQLKNAIFKRRDEKTQEYDLIAKAREADLRVDMAKHELIVRLRHGNSLSKDSRGYFEGREVAVPLPSLEKLKPGTRDMTWPELLQERRSAYEEQEKLDAEVDKAKAANNGRLPVDMERRLELPMRDVPQRVRNVETEIQMRPAQSFGCLFFVLVGCPVGIWFSRSDYLSAFISCFLPIVFLYYPLQLCTTNLARDGKLHPALALWSANLAMGLIALELFRRLLKN